MSVLRMGAVAYAPKVVTIWEGFKAWFKQHDLAFDYVLYSNYEALVEDLMHGRLDLAWNSPLAFVRAQRMAQAQGRQVQAIAMRDTDMDLQSVLVTRADGPIDSLAQLAGRAVGFGAVDSPQATLIPMGHMRRHGLLRGEHYQARLFDVLGGKHGDHIGGERDAAEAMASGEIDAAWMISQNYQLFAQEGTLAAGSTRIIAETGLYDHCNMTTAPGLDEASVERFVALLLGMSWDDPQVRPLLELEGLKVWHPGRTSGYALLEEAVDDECFYDAAGRITAETYEY